MTTSGLVSRSARLTPLDYSYPTCERTCAELRIYPQKISTRELSELLRITPSECGDAGDVRIGSGGRTRELQRTYWVLTSEHSIKSNDLRHHLDWLIEKVSPCTEQLAAFSNNDGGKITVCCIWWSALGHGGPTLWPEQMAWLASTGLEVGFDIQFHAAEG